MVAAALKPSHDYVAYAFRRPTNRSVYFYIAAALGEHLRFADSRDPVVRYQQMVHPETPEFDGFCITIGGLPIIGSNFRIQRNGREIIDRVRELTQPTPLGPYTIEFDWPSEQ